MTDLKPHRLWMAILAAALIIGGMSGGVVDAARQQAAARLAALQQENAKISALLRQLKDDMATAETMRGEIGDNDIEKFLMPVDRLRAAQNLERAAEQNRLTKFTYVLSPEQKTEIDTVGAGKQELALSRLIFSAEVPADTDAYAFIDSLSRALPGRLQLRELSLQRIDDGAEIAAANLRVQGAIDWLSNGARENLAEAMP